MADIIGAISLFVGGIIFILLSSQELKRNSATGNIFDAIFSAFLGDFELSGIGMLLIGVAFIILGVIVAV